MKIHVVLGSTGVGKTDRSVALARDLCAPVISLDRFQIFEDLAVGTGRPADQELAGTQRIYLARRNVVDGELCVSDAYDALLHLIAAWEPHHLILEGGSISLCTMLFEHGLLRKYPHEIECLSTANPKSHADRVRRRVSLMLAPHDGRRPISDELAYVWAHPARLAFVETIGGFNALTRYCRSTGIPPGKLGGRVYDPDLIDAITVSHLEYARRQQDQFERILNSHGSRTFRNGMPRRRNTVTPLSGTSDFDLSAPAQLDDPYPLYACLRAEAPVFYSTGIDAWVISRYDSVLEVLRDPERFSSAGVLKVRSELPAEVRTVLGQGIPYVRTLIDNDPPDHRRFRNLVNKAFVPKRIQALEPRIHTMTDALIDEFIAANRADLMERFAFRLPIYVIAGILGLPRSDTHDLKRWCDDWMALQSATEPVERLVKAAHNYVLMQQYFQQIVDERTRVPEDDLISALIEARVEGEAPLTRDELVRLLMSLLVAGHETTTHSIGNTLVLLFNHPPQLALLRNDPGLAALAFEEGLRMDPPVQSLFRRVAVDTEIAGVRLPAGARVMLLYGSANRDESQFEAPDRFDILRPPSGTHISFGRGIHYCVGASMARLEGRIALERLSRRLNRLRRDEAHALARIPHFFLRGYKQLHAIWDPVREVPGTADRPPADRKRCG